MKKITDDNLNLLKEAKQMLFIHSPFCGTCHLARAILEKIENKTDNDLFYEMNASLFPTFMMDNKIESVPCLFITSANGESRKIYSFEDMAKLSHLLAT